MASPDTGPTDGSDEADARVAVPVWGTYRPAFYPRFLIGCARHTFLNHGPFRRPLRKLFKRLHSGPIDYDVWGQQVRLYPHENVSDDKALFRPHRFDRKEFTQLRAAAREKLGGRLTFVDIGANVGFYSLYLLLHAPEADILAFEPNPVIFQRLKYNLRAFPQNRVKFFPFALGDSEGVATLQLAAGSSHIGEGGDGVEVRIRKLADVLHEERVSRIDVLKIDVEGYEDRVLQPFFAGASSALLPALLIIEHLSRDSWKYDCIGAAQALGYRIVTKSRNNTVLALAESTKKP